MEPRSMYIINGNQYMRAFDFEEFIKPSIDDTYKSRGIIKTGHALTEYTGNIMADLLKQMTNELQDEYPNRIFNLDRQTIKYKGEHYVVHDEGTINGKKVEILNTEKDSLDKIKEIFKSYFIVGYNHLYLHSAYSRIIGIDMNSNNATLRWDISYAID